MPRVWRYPVPRSARPAAAAVASAVAANARAPSFARNQFLDGAAVDLTIVRPAAAAPPQAARAGRAASPGRPFPFWGGLFGTCLWVAPIVAIDGGHAAAAPPAARAGRSADRARRGAALAHAQNSAPQRLTLPKLLTYTPSIAKGRRAPYISRAQAMLATSAAGSVHIETGKVS